MGKNTMNFGRGLKRARKKAGYKTQEIFASSVCKSIDTVRNWEQGKNKPSLDDFLSLCDFFDCDADYLLDNLDFQTHDLEFVCKYTGLSVEAVEKLHEISSVKRYGSRTIGNFSRFIVLYYQRFLMHLTRLEQGLDQTDVSLQKAKGDANTLQGMIEFNYANLGRLLFEFSEFCKKIPDGLFCFNQYYQELEKGAASAFLSRSEEGADDFFNIGDNPDENAKGES